MTRSEAPEKNMVIDERDQWDAAPRTCGPVQKRGPNCGPAPLDQRDNSHLDPAIGGGRRRYSARLGHSLRERSSLDAVLDLLHLLP